MSSRPNHLERPDLDDGDTNLDTDVAIIGGGSAAEALVRNLDGSGLRIAVFEPWLVGGECPYTACMPSKSLLHDAQVGRSWAEAVARRDSITAGLDDGGHAAELAERGVALIRDHARVGGPGVVEAGEKTIRTRHLVLATGARPVLPPIDGLDDCGDLVWTSSDALTSATLPNRLVVIGGGVIGIECAFLYSGFGTDVVLAESLDRLFADAPPAVSELTTSRLAEIGVDVRCGAEVVRLTRDGAEALVEFADGSTAAGDRVLVAVGRRASLDDLGLETLGLDPAEPLPLAPDGRVHAEGSVWAIGDVAGRGQYTHLANHQAAVVADHLAGEATRTFDDAVTPGCAFSSPPFIQVGPSWEVLRDDPDIVSTGLDLGTFPRAITDELAAGHLWVAARRSTGCVVAATGIGPGFDELVHALVIAIDGEVPVTTLRRTIQPFPTVGEILGPIHDDLHRQLAGR